MKELAIKLIDMGDGTMRVIAEPSVTGAQVSAAIRALGLLRQDLEPPLPSEPPLNVPNGIEVVRGQHWQLVNMLSGTSALLVLHSMYGWIGFQAGPALVASFADQLEKWSRSPPDRGPAH